MSGTEWWQRGPVHGVPALLQPVAHILLQVQESVGAMVDGLAPAQWNERPAGVASVGFHVRHITGVVDRLFTYARGEALTAAQFAALRIEGESLSPGDIPAALEAVGINRDRRPQTLAVGEWLALTEALGDIPDAEKR